MLLTIHNLPAATRYAEIKSLLQSKCGIQQVILDNLASEGNSKKVTVGVAEDADAAILTRKINGLFWNGQQLYVEDVRQQKAASDQPYRSLNPQPEPEAELPFNSMNLAQNSSYNMMAPQQMMTPVYYMPISAYPNVDTFGGNIMDTAQSYRQEKVQSAYPGISGFAQNASAAPQYGSSQFDKQQDYSQNASAAPQYGSSQYDNQQDYAQPAKRSRWEDENQDAANEKSLYGRRYDQNRDWQNNRAASPPRAQSRDSRKAAWQTDNDGPIQPDYRSKAGPTRPDFRPNVRPTVPDFRSTIRPEERSDFVRPGLLDKPRREFGSNIQRREDERQGRSHEREIFSRRPNADKFSGRPKDEVSRRQDDEFSRRPNDEFSRRPDDEFSRRPNDEFSRRPNDEFSRRPNDEFSRRPNDEFSRRPTERAEISRRPNVPDRSNERQGASQFSRRPSGREEPSRRPNEFFSKTNDREDRPRRTNEHAEFSRRPNVPSRSNDRQGTNQFSGRPNEFSERQGKPSRFNQPDISRSYSGFERNERPNVSGRAPGHAQRSIPDSRKRKFEVFNPKSSQKAFAPPPKPFKEQFPSQPIAAPPLTEQSKEKLNKRMRMSGINRVLHDIYDSLNMQDLDPITRRTFRQVVNERVAGLLGDKKMVTSMEILETYRANYPKSGDKATLDVVIERVAQNVEQGNGGTQEVKPAVKPVIKPVKPVVQPSPAATRKQMEPPSRPPPPKPPTRGERRAMKNLKDAKQLLAQGKLPSFPLGDKSKVSQQRKEEKLGIIPETEPIMTAALTEEVDKLLQICTDELANPPDEITRRIYKSVCTEEFVGEMRTIITQNLARRVTDSGLKVVRVYGRPKLPKREVLEKFLIKFGVQSLRKSDKVKMFTAAADTYENFDKLCNATFSTPDGITVHFKPFHAAPKQRADQTLLRKIRERNLKKMIDRSELNLLDKDWPAKEEEIKAREAEKQAALADECAAVKEQNVSEASQAVKTENVTEEPNENVQADLTNTTINEDDTEVDESNASANESNDYLHDDFHVVDEVNETDSDLECLDDTSNQVFYIDDFGDGDDKGVNNGNYNSVENDNENAVGDGTNDNNDNENDRTIENQNDGNVEEQNDTYIEDQNNEIVEASENNDGGNAYIDDNENDDNLLDCDGDFDMGDVDIDNLDVDLDKLDEGDLEDY